MYFSILIMSLLIAVVLYVMPTNSSISLSLVCMFWQFTEICLGDKPTKLLVAIYLVGIFQDYKEIRLARIGELHIKYILNRKDSFI